MTNIPPPAFQEALGCHEAFRKLGFTADDIFVHLGEDHSMQVVLQTQGKQFAVNVGTVDFSEQEWADRWQAFVRAVVDGTFPQEELDRYWQESQPRKNSVAFLLALRSQGIRIPHMSNKLN